MNQFVRGTEEKKNRKLERYIEASELAALYNVEPEVWADDRKRRAVYDLIGFLVFLQREKERERIASALYLMRSVCVAT